MIKKNMENLSNGNTRLMKNFTQTELWNRIKQRFGKKFVIPLFFYYDDFDIDNPLGLHRAFSLHVIGKFLKKRNHV